MQFLPFKRDLDLSQMVLFKVWDFNLVIYACFVFMIYKRVSWWELLKTLYYVWKSKVKRQQLHHEIFFQTYNSTNDYTNEAEWCVVQSLHHNVFFVYNEANNQQYCNIKQLLISAQIKLNAGETVNWIFFRDRTWQSQVSWTYLAEHVKQA